jgi:pimeloyl-ACP methyl ester carboxylesterase
MITFRDQQLPVSELGEHGPVIGYLHGILGIPSVPEFASILSRHGQRIVAPSLPGFSGTAACDQLRTIHDWVVALSEIIDLVGLSGKPMIASSIGAMLALELAAIRPEVFSELVLLAPFGLWEDAHPVADLYATTNSEERALLASTLSGTASFYEDAGVTDAATLVQRSVDRFVTRSTVASLIWPLPEHGLASRIHRARCPIYLIWGSEDRLVPPTYLERFAALLPTVLGTYIIPGAGHLAEWDKPGETANLLQTILRAGAEAEGGASVS